MRTNSFQQYKRRQLWRDVKRELPILIAHLLIAVIVISCVLATRYA